MPSKLEHALDLAFRGLCVFPIYASSGIPIKGWQDLSSLNPKTLEKWFRPGKPEYNIGIDTRKSGVTVVDVDVKNGKKGRESYESLEKEHQWPKTLTFKTPSGGLHLVFEGHGFKNSVEKLAPGLDIRGEGGLIIAPGSIKPDGKQYVILKDLPIAKIPAWLSEKLTVIGKATPLGQRESGKTIVSDLPHDIRDAITMLQQREGAVEGAGGDNHTYVTFCMLKERGISLRQAIELVDEYWNPLCSPPWDHDDLAKKAASAYKSAHNATGAKTITADFGLVMSAAPKLSVARFDAVAVIPLATEIPKRDWIYDTMFQAKQVGMLIAEPGVGKSTWTISMAISKIVGKPLLGLDPRTCAAVGMFNNEDNKEEMFRRIIACAQYHGVRREEIDKLYLNGRDRPLRIAKRLDDGRLKAGAAHELIDYALENTLRLLIIDPFSMTHPGNENSNEEILRVGEIYNYVAEKANAAVVIVHHTRKKDKASSEGHSGNLDSARGASALGGLVRSAYTLDLISQQIGKQRGIPEKERKLYIMLEQAKANMSAPGGEPKFFKRHGEIIGQTTDNIDGESVGVLLPVKLTHVGDPAQRVLIEDIEEVVKYGAKTIPDITRALLGLAMHSDKQPATLTKTMQRLFSDGIVSGYKGTLTVEERDSNGGRNPSKFIRFEPFENPAPSLSDVI